MRSLNAGGCQLVRHVISVELEEGKKVMHPKCMCVCVHVCVCGQHGGGVWWGSSVCRTIVSSSSS